MRNALFAFGLWAVALCAPAAAQTPSDQLQYLVGTWNCTVRRGVLQFSESETIVAMPASPWLHATGAATVKGRPFGTEDTYIGYDSKNARFVIVGITSLGAYFISTSTSQQLNGSKWRTAFPNLTGNSTFTENSASQYTIATTNAGGTTRQVCTRQ